MHLREVRIDKTGVIEEALDDHLAIALSGLPGTGRKTAAVMLVERHPEINAIYCDVEEIEDVSALNRRISGQPNWYLVRKPEKSRYSENPAGFRRFTQQMPREDRILFAVDSRIPDVFLEFVWSGIMAVILPESLQFTEEETYRYLKMCGSRLNGGEVYHMTGGWPGCAAMLVRLSEQLGEKWSVWELCGRYEIRQYIGTQILTLLPADEQKLLRERAAFPRLDEELEQLLWGAPLGETEDRLFSRGAMVFVPEGRYWYVHPALRIAIDDRIPAEMCTKAAAWYEEKGYIQAALSCSRWSEDRGRYKKCLMKNYDRVTFLNYEKVWGEEELKNPEFLYLEWMECVLKQDKGRQDELKKRIAELWDKVRRDTQTGANVSIDGSFAKEVIKKKEILLNVAYADTEIGTEEWMEMLQSCTEPGEKIRLYHILGESVSFLGGLRDLSVLFAGKGEKQEEWRRLWADRLVAENQAPYRLAELEYKYQTETSLQKDAWAQALPVYDANTPWQIRLGIMYLIWLLLDDGDKGEPARRYIRDLAESLEREETSACRWNARALYYLAMAKWGEKEKLMEWIRQTGGDIGNNTGKTKFYMAAEVKISLYLGDYGHAEEILPELIAWFRRGNSRRWLAESLFQRALIEQERGRIGQALMTTAESIEIADPCRYVRLYTSYGNRGAELLEQYAGLNIPEKVVQRHFRGHENGKSADVFAMKKEEWIRYIADEAVRRKDDSPVPPDDQARARQGERLTPTEMLVLQYLEKGYSNSRIGEEMNISLSTVKSHTYNIYRKLEVSNRIQAVQAARDYGLM